MADPLTLEMRSAFMARIKSADTQPEWRVRRLLHRLGYRYRLHKRALPSRVRADRPQLAKLMARLQPGDIVVVTKVDRFGRSTRELLDLIDRIGKAGAAFRFLGDPLWDTSNAQGRLLSTLLAAIAEFERELIRERTGEGRKRAMANGVKFRSAAVARVTVMCYRMVGA